jgi:hypothetical protein
MMNKKHYKTTDWCEKTLMQVAREAKEAQKNTDVSPLEKKLLRQVQSQVTSTIATIEEWRRNRNMAIEEQSIYQEGLK